MKKIHTQVNWIWQMMDYNYDQQHGDDVNKNLIYIGHIEPVPILFSCNFLPNIYL